LPELKSPQQTQLHPAYAASAGCRRDRGFETPPAAFIEYGRGMQLASLSFSERCMLV